MAYAVRFTLGTHYIAVPDLSGSVTVEINYSANHDNNFTQTGTSSAPYIMDSRQLTGSVGWLAINHATDKMDASGWTSNNIYIDDVVEPLISGGTVFSTSGFANLAGKTLKATIASADGVGNLIIGNRYDGGQTRGSVQEIEWIRITDNIGTRLYNMDEGSGSALTDANGGANATIGGYVDDSCWVLLGGGGTTHEASVSFAHSCGVTVGGNAVINADASFAQAFGMSQGGAGSFNCDAEMGFLINSIAQSVADVNAQIIAGIASSSIAEATAITNADAVINIAHGTVAAGGLSLNAVAEFAVSHAIQTDSDISIEALADFGMSCGLLCAAITEANAEISIDVLHNAVAETVAIIHAQAAYGITSGLSVTRTIVTDAGITCSITSSFVADGALQVEGVITTPAGRTMKILAENRTMKILLENRTMKILGDNNAN